MSMEINYVKAHRAMRETARKLDLDSRQRDVLEGLFEVMNDLRWPEGMVRISNKRLLGCTGLKGIRADRALREIRQQLADLGLIAFTQGDRTREDPSYRIVWSAFGVGASPAADADAVSASKNGPRQYNNISTSERSIKPQTGERKRTPAAKPMPTADEIRSYAAQIGLEVNPLRFIDWHAARGIRLDDWRAALRTCVCGSSTPLPIRNTLRPRAERSKP